MYKRIHGNLGSFVPPPVRQGSGKLTRFACSNNASPCPLCSQKVQNCLTNAYYTWRSPFYCIRYVTWKMPYLSTIPLPHKNCLLVCSYIFYCHNVESHRYTWQNKHLFENPWVGAHSVRTENHCLNTQSVRVWFAVLTIGGASPRTKDFLLNVHLSCAPAAFGPFGNLSDLSWLNPNILL